MIGGRYELDSADAFRKLETSQPLCNSLPLGTTRRPDNRSLALRTVVYFIYGAGPFVEEATFSLRSAVFFLPPDSDIRFVVFSDRPLHFPGLPVEVITLSSQQMTEWTGRHGYHHRMKLCVFSDALRRFGGSVAFIDTDTYFLKSPEQLFRRIAPGRSILHVPEAPLRQLDEPGFRAISDIIASGKLRDADGVPIMADKKEVMWNSGVIGVHERDGDVIARSIDLMDQIKDDPRSAAARQLEQFVVGYHLSRSTRTRACDDIVFHYWYWDLKRPFREILPSIIHHRQWAVLKPCRPRTSLPRKAKMLMRVYLRRLGFSVPGIRGSV